MASLETLGRNLADEMASQAQPLKLFVGGISAQTTTEMLSRHFSRYGLLTDAVVMMRQGRARGFGFVSFASEAAAARALSEPQMIDDRLVDVKRAVPGERPVERPCNKIFIGGLAQEVTTEKLRAYFGAYGTVADAVVMVDRKTGRSRGFGFIRFAHGRQGALAAEAVLRDFEEHWLEGKWVDVKPATPAATLEEMAARYLQDAEMAICNQWASATAYHYMAAARRRRPKPPEPEPLSAPLPHLLGTRRPSQWPKPPGHLLSPMKVPCNLDQA